jgi:hypothetical protein
MCVTGSKPDRSTANIHHLRHLALPLSNYYVFFCCCASTLCCFCSSVSSISLGFVAALMLVSDLFKWAWTRERSSTNNLKTLQDPLVEGCTMCRSAHHGVSQCLWDDPTIFYSSFLLIFTNKKGECNTFFWIHWKQTTVYTFCAHVVSSRMYVMKYVRCNRSILCTHVAPALDCNCYFSDSFQSIICLPTYHSTACRLATDNVLTE